MKILLLTSSYLPVTGGLQTVASSLACSLKDRGHDVSVVTNRYPTKLAAGDMIDDVSISRWHFLFPRLDHLLNLRPDLFVAGLVLFPLTLFRLLARIQSNRPDVVNLHFVDASALFVLIARKFVNFRLVVSLHGNDVEGLSRRRRFDRWVFRTLLRKADVVTACSGYLLALATKIQPAAAARGRVVYNGMDLLVSVSNGEPDGSVAAAGRLVPQKGFDVLLRAFAAGAKDTSRLSLIGDGPERERLQELARDLGLNGEISFRGANERRTTLAAMNQANVIAIPSLSESFGMVALEGMALGKPIVASRVGGLPEILDGADAVLVEPGDPKALANAIEETLKRSKSEPDFGRRNRECAARFSLQRMVDGYLESYIGQAGREKDSV